MLVDYRQHAEHYQRIINSFADETSVSADGNKAVSSADDDMDDATPVSTREEREMAIA